MLAALKKFRTEVLSQKSDSDQENITKQLISFNQKQDIFD